jgi:hypothetical protein
MVGALCRPGRSPAVGTERTGAENCVVGVELPVFVGVVRKLVIGVFGSGLKWPPFLLLPPRHPRGCVYLGHTHPTKLSNCLSSLSGTTKLTIVPPFFFPVGGSTHFHAAERCHEGTRLLLLVVSFFNHFFLSIVDHLLTSSFGILLPVPLHLDLLCAASGGKVQEIGQLLVRCLVTSLEQKQGERDDLFAVLTTEPTFVAVLGSGMSSVH